MTLPRFTYHPDPIATGSVIASPTVCVSCHQARGYVYTGPVYAEEEYDAEICPWCIADGSASARLDASFTDDEGIGGGGEWDEVPEAVVEEVARRTPGFSAWQQEKWWTHCGDAGQSLAVPGRRNCRHWVRARSRRSRTAPGWMMARSGTISSVRCARTARPPRICSAARTVANWVATRTAIDRRVRPVDG